MIRRLLHHSGKPLLSGFDGVSISHTFKVFLLGRNVYTSRSVHSLAGGRLIEPPYWNSYSWRSPAVSMVSAYYVVFAKSTLLRDTFRMS